LVYPDTIYRIGDKGLNEKRIQQVLEIEKQANTIREAAIAEAAQLPVQAEKEAQAMLEKARAEAARDAEKLIASAQADNERSEIMSRAEQNIQHIETIATSNLNRAVAYVLARVVGRE
jgi:vacuolar-type H+-ATPase subunit H